MDDEAPPGALDRPAADAYEDQGTHLQHTYTALEIMPMIIEQFEPQCEDEALWKAYAEFKNEIARETMPIDPPQLVEDFKLRMRNRTALEDHRTWLIRRPGTATLAATANTYFEDRRENRHLIRFGIQVRAELRRQGLGTRLLQKVAETSSAAKRTLLVTHTTDAIPAGDAFLKSLGAQCAQLFHLNQLTLAEVDRDLLRAWQARAAERAAGFDLVHWHGDIPEDQLQAVCDLTKVMNTAPRGNLKREDWKITPQQLRVYERVRRTLKIESWMIAAREKASDKLAGYTTTHYEPAKPHFLHQGETGVWPQYRGLGLGRWLKAAMIERVLAERPAIEYVRTGNANNNAPMMKINRELGFKLYREQGVWQASLGQVEAYLRRRTAHVE